MKREFFIDTILSNLDQTSLVEKYVSTKNLVLKKYLQKYITIYKGSFEHLTPLNGEGTFNYENNIFIGRWTNSQFDGQIIHHNYLYTGTYDFVEFAPLSGEGTYKINDKYNSLNNSIFIGKWTN